MMQEGVDCYFCDLCLEGVKEGREEEMRFSEKNVALPRQGKKSPTQQGNSGENLCMREGCLEFVPYVSSGGGRRER